MSSKKQSKKQEDDVSAEQPVKILPDEPVSKVSINKYDPFQLKGSIDDECVNVSLMLSIITWFALDARREGLH
jgi:hypothetical protein